MSANLPGEGFCGPPEGFYDVWSEIMFVKTKCEQVLKSEINRGFFQARNSRIRVNNEHRSSRGNYLRHRVNQCLFNFYLTTLILFVIFSSCTANIMGEHCDWSGNGLSLSSSQSRGVTPVYLRCSQGHISWSYPRGALRVLLRLPNSEKEFRGCIKVVPEFSGARLFLEGPRSLTPLFSLNDGAHKQLVRCFQSKKGQAAIYVEAVNSGIFKKDIAGFSYDLHPVPRGSSVFDLINEGCRPCSRQEMAHAFCTSDIVTRGLIYGIDIKHELEIAEINVKIIKVLRHSTDDLYKAMSTLDFSEVKNSSENEVEKSKYNENDILKVAMPRHCNPHHGPGEFVFMARKKLGDLSLVCVSSLSEWAEIVRTKNSDGVKSQNYGIFDFRTIVLSGAYFKENEDNRFLTSTYINREHHEMIATTGTGVPVLQEEKQEFVLHYFNNKSHSHGCLLGKRDPSDKLLLN